MSAMEEVARLKKEIDRLKITKARLEERLSSEKAEKERLLKEAAELGVTDPTKLLEWVKAQKAKFLLEKEKIEQLIREANKSPEEELNG